MGLFWKDLEIVPGMLLEVDLLHQDAVSIMWRILSFNSRTGDQAYINYKNGKKYPMKKVIKSRRLQAKVESGEILQMPTGSEFMIVQEIHDDEEGFRRCYNLDLLGIVRNIRPAENPG